jgi:hypothetical protein
VIFTAVIYCEAPHQQKSRAPQRVDTVLFLPVLTVAAIRVMCVPNPTAHPGQLSITDLRPRS